MTASAPPSRSVFVVGATGAVGDHVVRLLVEAGHRVTGMHRSDGDADEITGRGAAAVRGDLVEDFTDELAARLQGHDAVIFSAGAGGDGAEDVDRDGAKKAMDAAAAAGIRRFVLVSVFMDASRGDASPGDGFEQYVAAKRAADMHLGASDLDFVIVRPGRLSDDDATGSVDAGISVAYRGIPREDVAAFLVATVFSPLTRIAVEVTGGAQPVQEAVDALHTSTYTG